MTIRQQSMSILHMVISLKATSTQYNEHCLPLAHKRDISICSFFKAAITPSNRIVLFEGDGTLRGFWRAASKALSHERFDVIHVHAPQAGVLLIAMTLLKRRSLANAVYTVHNSYQNYSVRNKLFLFPVFKFFPHIVLCSNAVLESLPRRLRKLGEEKLSIVQNGVDTERVDRVLASFHGHNPDRTFTVVSVARLIERKNPSTVMAAFALHGDPDDSLLYVGDGDLRQELVEQTERLGQNDRVRFTGTLGREDVYRCLAESDVFISASRGEGLPVAVLEAMACGRPVILSDIPPHREVVGDADFVPLIPPDDVDSFAREIQRIKQMSHAQRAALGERCRELVEERFSLRAMHRSYEKVYATAMGQ